MTRRTWEKIYKAEPVYEDDSILSSCVYCKHVREIKKGRACVHSYYSCGLMPEDDVDDCGVYAEMKCDAHEL
jgi:hypothetical protein